MKKLKIIAIVIALLCAAFLGVVYYMTPKGEKIVDIEGELIDVPDGLEVKLVWTTFRARYEEVDTVYNGHFSFHCDGSNDKGVYRLYMCTLNATGGTTKDITLYRSKNIKITGQGDNILSWNVESDNPRQPFHNKLNNLVSDEFAKIERQKEALETASQLEKDSIQSLIDSLNIVVGFKRLDAMMSMPIDEDWEYALLDIAKTLVDDANHPLRGKVADAYALMPEKRKHKIVGTYISECLQTAGVGGNYIDISLFDKSRRQHSLSEQVGNKWLLLDFSDYYCGYCHALCPTLKYLSETYGDGLQLVTISNDNEKDFNKMVEEDGITWPAFYNQDAYSKYGISGRPTFILISPEGVIAERIVGANPDWLLKTFLKYSENANPRIVKTEGIATIELPSITGGINGFSIEKIALYPDSTLVSFVYLDLSNNYSIGSGSVLRCSDGTVCKAISSSIGFDNYVDRKQVVRFNATFEPLPEGVESFDYVEGDCDNCFSVKGVKVAGY